MGVSTAAPERIIRELLARADVRIDGDGAGDIAVHDRRLYGRILRDGSLGLGEAYMEGWWDAEPLDEFFSKVLWANLDKRLRRGARMILRDAAHSLLNRQSRQRAFQIGVHHYDIGNDLYRAMLDGRMTYSCGYWKDARNLDEAQEAKPDMICRKIGLSRGQSVLDIGCGWGSFARFAAERYGARLVGLTVSKEQVALGNEMCRGLPVEMRLQDYRDERGHFDHVVSIGMFEHVGDRNYRTFMRVVHRCLKSGGLFLLHTIGGNESVRATDPWITKYIFPNSMLPSAAQLAASFEGLFVMEDWHNFATDYDKTLMAWFSNFDARWNDLRGKYGDPFYRMWKYYLLSCAGAFRSRQNQLWQIVLSKGGVRGGYVSMR